MCTHLLSLCVFTKTIALLSQSLHGDHSDIDGKNLFLELRIFRETLPKEINRAMENFVNHTSYYCLCRKKFFKNKVEQILSSINYVTIKIE
ncbi:hypothetical protein DVH24_022861 [Malus domestica]|uniref:Uncharacterized protein n=1 Tax=Malus domestica TaxID=3750 RepID=A0A498KMI3_MALDO|nr:hypothetical protein DVH24_022861 [Malus domestica]